MVTSLVKSLTTLFCLIGPTPVVAQTDSVYTFRYLDRSTRFAATTLGADLLIPGGGTSTINAGAGTQQVDFGPAIIPRLSIGGVHFWGHAEFYVTFPLNFLTLQDTPEELTSLNYRQGIETGARVYPFALKPGSVRPFVGASFRLLSFQQQVPGSSFSKEAPTYQRMIFPVHLGLTYANSKMLISLSGQYQSLRSFDYYNNYGITGDVSLAPFSIQLGITRYWDTDKNMREPGSVANENNKYALLKKEQRLSSWYWGLGPSAGLQVSESPFLETQFPHLANDFIGGFIPDITFGRFFHKPDMNIGLSYRTMGSRLQGFDDEVSLRRHSFMLEAYKNLFNYLGFVPFLGVTGSIENLRTTVNGTTYREQKPALGLIFGWDIRVTKTGTSLLRTNLRYIPNLHMTINGEKMMFNQLEFNFIQWVQFIGRNKVYRKYSR
jgi:hypothetical protein